MYRRGRFVTLSTRRKRGLKGAHSFLLESFLCCTVRTVKTVSEYASRRCFCADGCCCHRVSCSVPFGDMEVQSQHGDNFSQEVHVTLAPALDPSVPLGTPVVQDAPLAVSIYFSESELDKR